MQEYYAPIILFLGLVLFVFLYDYIGRKNREKNLMLDIKNDFGKVHSNKFKGKIDGIYKKLGGNLTEITYEDLNFDKVIEKMNHSVSRLGLEYFYYKIRNINLDSDELLKDIRNRNSYKDKESLLQKIQFIFQGVGYFKDDVLGLLDDDTDVDGELVAAAKIFSFTAIYIIISIFIFQKLAFFVAVVLLAGNTYIYKEFNKKTMGKLNALLKLRNMIFAAEKLTRYKDEVFFEELDEIERLLREIAPLKKSLKSFGFLSGNPEFDWAETYKNILFLTEARQFTSSQKYFKSHGDKVFRLYYLMGKIDAEIGMISVIKAYDAKDATFGDRIYGKKLYNPLLKSAVPNDLDLSKSILLTGSNASGKSTYLRTCGINAVFALTFGIFFGESFEIEPIIISSAIDISDSLSENLSYFMAESKAIVEMINQDKKQLILLDEIFRGTNTIDRISAASSTLRYLESGNYVIAATHDIELTILLEDIFANKHFEEKIEDGDIKFDYLLKDGAAKTRNAIAILENLNYPKKVTEEARKLSKDMEEE
ncbi:MutS-related protein [Peptoniphilus sp.]|jgi:hypothetical protein|uniref:MutS-related protein n=1 Tax=Peptoniphilus sp. TaxID=1971214 RepID=UPI003D93CD64